MSKKLIHILTNPLDLNFFRAHLDYMLDQGLNIHIISSPGLELIEFGKRNNIEVFSIKMFRGITPFKDIFSFVKMIIYLFNERPDIVHTHTPKASFVGLISAFIVGVPRRIYQVHGLKYLTQKGLKRKVLMIIEKILCRIATEVIVVSPSNKEVMIKHQISNNKKLSVLKFGSFSGVDSINIFNPDLIVEEKLLSLKKDYDIKDSYLYLGYVGRLAKDKGIDNLIFIWDRIKEKYPNIRLLISGKIDEDDSIKIEKYEKLLSDPRVVFLGWIEEVQYAYYMMDILLFPSHREGLGRVTLEAGSMLTPTVAFDIPGVCDTIQDEKTGFKIEAFNNSKFMEKVELLIRNKSVRTKMGIQARSFASETFNPFPINHELYEKYYK